LIKHKKQHKAGTGKSQHGRCKEKLCPKYK
jgi:hypothetical protein